MTDVTQATASQEPGPQRTAEGTIVDQSPSAASNQSTTPDSTTSQQTPSPDGKTLLTQETKPEAKPEAKPEGKAPEKYEDYKLPEGYTLDAEVKTKADKLFKGMGLNQDQAQSLVDFYTEQANEAFQAPFEAYQKMTSEWKTEAENHPDLRGKLGPGQEVNVRIAKALDGLGDPKLASDFKELMDLTGAGNNQAFIRVIDRFAQRLTEGTHVAGNGPTKAGQSRPGEAPPTAAGALWPNLPSAGGGR